MGQIDALTMDFDWVYELRLHYVREGAELVTQKFFLVSFHLLGVSRWKC